MGNTSIEESSAYVVSAQDIMAAPGETYDTAVQNYESAKKLESNSAEISASLRRMESFDNTTFGVGETNAFKTLSDDFESAISDLSAQIDAYVSYANACMEAVGKAIKKDEQALEKANKAAADVKPVYTSTGEKDKDGNDISKYDEAATIAARKAAFDAAWEKYRWKSPEFKVSHK